MLDDVRSTEESYRAYWAVLTGKSPSEIYVPEAIREGSDDQDR